ncbi:MAG: linalool dehydratase/isomerase domain-containing protein, partial [Acidimicrobiia bacterium]
IGADGNLFFKGFFLVMLGLHLRTTGDERWNDPFDIVRDGENTFTWFHSAIAEHLHDQWQHNPDGCHCENTKIWPYCLAGAGLGLQLHDLLRDTNHHDVFKRWWTDVCRDRYLHLDGDELPQSVTLYYDPIVDAAHEVPVFAGMVPAIYLAPQEPEGARRLFEAGMTQLGLWEPSGAVALPGPRASATALWLAREWDLQLIAAALSEAIDAQYEPTFDPTTGEFTWGFELDEEYPRGQYNGTMAAAQIATEGSWWRLANERPGSRFTDPTVEGVDFPTLSLDEAWWDAERSELSIGTMPVNDAVVGRPTRLRVVNLDEPQRWTVTDAGRDEPIATSLVERGIEIHTTIDRHRLTVSGPSGTGGS